MNTNDEGITIGEVVRKEIEQIFVKLADEVSSGRFGEVELSPLELFRAQSTLIATWDAYIGA